MTKLRRYRGDTKAIQFAFTDSENAPLDITGAVITMSVDPSENPSNADNQVASVVATITDALGGLAKVTLPDTIPAGDYWYDVQILYSGGEIETVIKNELFIVQDITK